MKKTLHAKQIRLDGYNAKSAPEQPPLAERISADVCIVGAGIAGMTTAYLLSREGKSVVVLDDGPLAAG